MLDISRGFHEIIMGYTLWQLNIAIESGNLEWVFPVKIVKIHSYVSLPKVKKSDKIMAEDGFICGEFWNSRMRRKASPSRWLKRKNLQSDVKPWTRCPSPIQTPPWKAWNVPFFKDHIGNSETPSTVRHFCRTSWKSARFNGSVIHKFGNHDPNMADFQVCFFRKPQIGFQNILDYDYPAVNAHRCGKSMV